MDTLYNLTAGIPFPCEIHHARFNHQLREQNKGNNNIYRVYINSTEPQTSCEPVENVIINHKYFDLILTKTPKILDNCTNAQLFLFGDTWIDDTPLSAKSFSVSFLCSVHINPNLAYRQRQELWDRQQEINIPKQFWSSRLNPISNVQTLPYCVNEYKEKLPLFDSMFSVCMENSREHNYFTEKIIDCLRSKTIPIYWGCPNISEYFNMDGIIIVNDISELIKVCNNLTPEFYHKYENAIVDNYERSKAYFPIKERIQSAVINSKLNLEK